MALKINTAVLDKMADKVGLFRFSEFCKNPDAYRPKKTNTLDIVSHGSDHLRHLVDSYEFKFGHWKTDSLERIEDIVLGQGYKLEELDIEPVVEQSYKGNGKYKLCVNFIIKKEGKDAEQSGPPDL